MKLAAIFLLALAMMPAPVLASPAITGNVSTGANTANIAATGYATAAAYSAEVANNDLPHAGQATLTCAAWDQTPFFTTNSVNDGTGHPAGSSAGTFIRRCRIA